MEGILEETNGNLNVENRATKHTLPKAIPKTSTSLNKKRKTLSNYLKDIADNVEKSENDEVLYEIRNELKELNSTQKEIVQLLKVDLALKYPDCEFE